MAEVTHNMQTAVRADAFRAEIPGVSPKAPCFRDHLSSAYQSLEGDITDVFYAGEILQHLMHDLMSDADPTPLTRHETNMILHAMYLVTNRASDLKDKYYAGFKTVPTEGTA